MNNTDHVDVPLKQVGQYFAHRPGVEAIRFWVKVGLVNGFGERIRLRTRMEGGRRYTTEGDIQRFKDAVREGRE